MKSQELLRTREKTRTNLCEHFFLGPVLDSRCFLHELKMVDLDDFRILNLLFRLLDRWSLRGSFSELRESFSINFYFLESSDVEKAMQPSPARDALGAER